MLIRGRAETLRDIDGRRFIREPMGPSVVRRMVVALATDMWVSRIQLKQVWVQRGREQPGLKRKGVANGERVTPSTSKRELPLPQRLV